MTFYGYGEDTFSISSWNLEETEGKAALRRELNERFRNEHPDRSHLISQASQYEYTDVFGEGIEESEEGDELFYLKGNPAVRETISPLKSLTSYYFRIQGLSQLEASRRYKEEVLPNRRFYDETIRARFLGFGTKKGLKNKSLKKKRSKKFKGLKKSLKKVKKE